MAGAAVRDGEVMLTRGGQGFKYIIDVAPTPEKRKLIDHAPAGFT
jgi:hypothetical protein